VDASSGAAGKGLRDPDQEELQLGDRPSHIAFLEGPWQIELIYRIALDTLATLFAIGSRWLVDHASELLLSELDWSLAIVVWMFNLSVLVVVTVGVLWDLGAFVLRRIPRAWKRQILSWRSAK
jgi:hypothetical protein